jgi:hypothetical protein
MTQVKECMVKVLLAQLFPAQAAEFILENKSLAMVG